MNDCLWAFLCNVCTGDSCTHNCNKYLSVNTDKGEELLCEYQHEVDEALIPLSVKWREKMNEYTTN